MKFIVTVLLITCCWQLSAQKSFFIRVYNLEGKKINKGKVVNVTDTSLELQGRIATVSISVQTIGLIKTKRSEGHNVFIGSLISSSLLVILFAATADPNAYILPWTVGQGVAFGLFLGLPSGALIGSLTIPFKDAKTFIINGDLSKWKAFQRIASSQ